MADEMMLRCRIKRAIAFDGVHWRPRRVAPGRVEPIEAMLPESVARSYPASDVEVLGPAGDAKQAPKPADKPAGDAKQAPKPADKQAGGGRNK